MIGYKETRGQERAWRVGGLKIMLWLLCKEYGKDKVKKELEVLEEEFVF